MTDKNKPERFRLVPVELLKRLVARDDEIELDDDRYCLDADVRMAIDDILAGPLPQKAP